MSSSRFQLLESRLNALHEAHKNTVQLINRLTNSKQQTPAQSESDLISEIHDNLKAEDEELDILRQELQDSTYSEPTFRTGSEREKEQAALAVQVARLGEDFRQFVLPNITWLRIRLFANRTCPLAQEPAFAPHRFNPNATLS